MRFVMLGFSVVGGLAMVVAGQRSSLVSVVIGVGLLLLVARKIKGVLLMFGALAVAWLVLSPQINDLEDMRSYNLVTRMDQGSDDLSMRVNIQLWAAGQIPSYPFGVVGAGLDYKALAPVYGGTGTRVIAPHNGFITRTLLYGWPVLILLAILAVHVLKMARESVCDQRFGEHLYLEWTCLGGVVAGSVNALFHNASVLSFQEETLVCLFLYAALRRISAQRSKPLRRLAPLAPDEHLRAN
jgi:hypothetical protein